MNIRFTARHVAAGALALVVGFGAAAHAADVTFVMKNSHQNAVEVELYSQDRDHVWPGDGKVFLFDDGETKTMSLSCDTGETICYGAWVSGDEGTYWGVGPGNQDGCEDCCYTCSGGMTEEVELTE